MDTRRLVAVAILVVIVLMLWATYDANREAEATGDLLALLAYGQASTPVWRPVIPVPEMVHTLRDGQLFLCVQSRHVLTAQIANIASKPAGYYVTVADPLEANGRASVSKEDWLINANLSLAGLDLHISALGSN